ncbi:MAG: aspartate--tRNA ligase [Candidatus Gracilibacteria bacterium]|nr:aspartate--tRNA ligase [Candidatus Gracilibacteria bacterium]
MHRTHTCGELTKANIGQEITLSGWVANRRDHGGVIFIDLRDRYGITQTVFDPADNKEAWELADKFRGEYVVKLTGIVKPRMEGQTNSNLPTGDIEIKITKAELLMESKTPPFEINDHVEANEEVRLKHRYLDLRRKSVQDNIIFRAKMNRFTHNWFSDNGFLEVQTPIFTVSSPEGARDYVIPSRLQPGQFYALPQSPQQYKQLLMIGGIDKYYQIAPCFRDEDPRADRHSCEFYQIDVEMSFVEQDDIFKVAEGFVNDLIPGIVPEKHIYTPEIPAGVKSVIGRDWKTGNRFIQLTHKESQTFYGSDKPDLRFDMHFEDFTADFNKSEFSVFKDAVDNGGCVKAMKMDGVNMSRKDIDEVTEVARGGGAKGLAYIIYDEEGPRSPILKYFSESEIKALETRFSPKSGDMIFFGAGSFKAVVKSMNVVRLALRDKFNLADKNAVTFAWVTDFPMFELDKETGKIDFEHNPFSMPHGGVTAFDNPNVEEIYGMQYDMSCNGYEILSGSIRNHNLKALTKAMEMVGKSEEDVKRKFGAIYNAFQYGVPPHGGFAFGFDRIMMILTNEENIRAIYAFPKSGKAEDTMMCAPSYIESEQLEELHIDIRPEIKEELGME